MTGRKRIWLLAFVVLIGLYPAAGLRAQGHFEFGFHYGPWTLDVLRSTIEGAISDGIENETRNKFLEEVQADHPNLREKSYSQSVEFDSGGHNWGFEVRWYPGGDRGSFSLGLALEKSKWRVSLTEVSVDMELEDSVTHEIGSLKGTTAGDLLLSPLAFLLNFRWDLFPSSRVRPFITFGAGLAAGSVLEDGTISYDYEGDLSLPGESPETYSGSESKSIKELKEEAEAEGEEEFFLPSVIPFLQLELGIKAAVTQNVYVLLDAGILNGFVLRGGIAIRI